MERANDPDYSWPIGPYLTIKQQIGLALAPAVIRSFSSSTPKLLAEQIKKITEAFTEEFKGE